jgi:hypothetical protein
MAKKALSRNSNFETIDWKADEGKAAASFRLQVEALVPDMFCNFCLAKKSQNC